MNWFLVLSLMLGFITPKLHAFECGGFLAVDKLTDKSSAKRTTKQPSKSSTESSSSTVDFYKSIKYLVPYHTQSKTLTKEQKALLRKTIKDLKATADLFNKTYNNRFKSYGTFFLSELRGLFQSEETNLRSENQLLINELERFLDNGKDLRFRDLDMISHAKSNSQSWAVTYLDHPNDVFFNLNYYVSSHLRDGSIVPGYVFSKEEHEDLKASVYVLDMKPETMAQFIDQNFPASQVKIPRLKDSNLVFPGLPLNDQLLDFLNEHGDENGRLRIAAQRFYPKQNSLIPSFINRPKPLPILDTRWSAILNKHYDLRAADGRINISLSNLKNYYEANGRLMIPTIPVNWAEKHKTLFQRQDQQVRLHLVVSENLGSASFTVAPTGFEFVTAFVELVQM